MTVRVYGPLNDFLPPSLRQRAWVRRADDHSSVKDLLESVGVPHPEIDLLLVNDEPVGFDYLIRAGDRIAALPRFVGIDIAAVTRVRPEQPAIARFVADVHLGKLARHLRLAGLDTVYTNDAEDAALAAMAAREHRVLLTRDQSLLKRANVALGYYVRETSPRRQFVEVLRRFDPGESQPFTRCLRCNGLLRTVGKADVDASLLPRTREHYDQFATCAGCGRIYWKGSHWARLQQALDAVRAEAGLSQTAGRAPEIRRPADDIG